MEKDDFIVQIGEEKKKRPVKRVVFISVLLTFVFTLMLVYVVIAFALPRVMKIPLVSSITSSGYGDAMREVRAYIDEKFLYDIDEEAMEYGACQGMVAALGDKYTRYLTPDEFKEYLDDGDGNYVGIGVIFTVNKNNEITVVGIYPDSPGSKAGLKVGDILSAVDGKQCTVENYNEMIEYIRGEHIDINERENTSFELEYIRTDESGNKSSNKVEIVRQKVHVNSVSAEMKESNIGYISVSSFNRNTHEEFCNAYDKLAEQGMKELIIDLRDNGGGDFDVAVEMAGYFLEDKSLVVYTVDKNGKKTEFHSKEKKYFIKPVILVNSNTASASEVFTGALRDNGALKAIVGTKTFGKGITQNVYSMRSGGGLIVTVDTYYTPSDDKIHEKGIEPTDMVEIDEPYNQYPVSYYSEEVDKQLSYAVGLLR